jgi:hypothetical protein
VLIVSSGREDGVLRAEEGTNGYVKVERRDFLGESEEEGGS